jgi:hypothetical protein
MAEPSQMTLLRVVLALLNTGMAAPVGVLCVQASLRPTTPWASLPGLRCWSWAAYRVSGLVMRCKAVRSPSAVQPGMLLTAPSTRCAGDSSPI